MIFYCVYFNLRADAYYNIVKAYYNIMYCRDRLNEFHNLNRYTRALEMTSSRILREIIRKIKKNNYVDFK